MLNVIRMELHRLFRSRSFYITIGICAGVIILLTSLFAALINLTGEMDADGASPVNCPLNTCASLTGGMCSLFAVIFAACFTGAFYSGGFCKNVICSVKNRYYFQIAKTVCLSVYSGILLIVASLAGVLSASGLVNHFEFVYMGEYLKYLLGEFCLLTVLAVFSALLTELTGSKVPAIVYFLLSATSLLQGILSIIDGKLADWLNINVELEKFLPSFYHNLFSPSISDTSGNNQLLIHAVVLSLVYLLIYNAAGSCLITKRDIK